MRISRWSRRVRIVVGGFTTVLLVAGLTVGIAQSAAAALPSAPTATGLTGSRPSATRLTFPISDQVSATVDVGTGNLEVSEQAYQLPGVLSPVPLTAAFNSMSQTAGSTSTTVANKWIQTAASAGSLTMASGTGHVVFIGPDGSTWDFAPVSGSSTAFTSPAGLQATLLAQLTGGSVTGYTLTYLLGVTAGCCLQQQWEPVDRN